jgi:hypothetical protein
VGRRRRVIPEHCTRQRKLVKVVNAVSYMIAPNSEKGKAAMATHFENFKLSFIWVETIPAIGEQRLGDKTPWGFLGMPGQFAKKFADLKAANGGTTELQIPWRKPRGQRFWKHYFAGQHAGDIAGDLAWRNRVPLRSKSAVQVVVEPPEQAELQGVKVTFEVFYMSQGLGLVANAYYRGSAKSAEEITRLAHAVRGRYRFSLKAPEESGAMSLLSAAEHVLATVRRRSFGSADAWSGHNQPFTIATFVCGKTDTPNVAADSGVHRALEGLTNWNDDWESTSLSQASLQSGKLEAVFKRNPNDLIYAREKGRAIWLPREFTKPPPADPPRLSCYHRNLTLASLQALSLGECVDLIAGRRQRGETVPPLLLQRAREAARTLDTLVAGDAKETYRTISVDKQVKAANWLGSIANLTG